MNPNSNTQKQPSDFFSTGIKQESVLQNIKVQPGETPYHLDGDTDMYTQQNIQKRKLLFPDPEIQKQLTQLIALYKFTGGELKFEQYKRVHEKIALVIRPDIDKDELEFVVKQDFEMDNQGGPITPDKLKQLLFDMVDVWTTTVQKSEYLKFIRQLKDKLKYKLKH